MDGVEVVGWLSVKRWCCGKDDDAVMMMVMEGVAREVMVFSVMKMMKVEGLL